MTECKVFLNRERVGVTHSENVQLGDSCVYLFDVETEEKVFLVDKERNICNFPGIEYSKALVEEYGEREIAPVVRYYARFQRQTDGTYAMYWTVRPDGMYWADSWGFGAEDYDAIVLRAFFDSKGCFTGPFRLYCIGSRRFC